MDRKLYNSAWKLVENSPQLSQENKDEFLLQLQKDKSSFELIYGINNRQINQTIEEKSSNSEYQLLPTLKEEILNKFSEEWEYNFGINYNKKQSQKETVDAWDLLNLIDIDQKDILNAIDSTKDIWQENNKFLDIIQFGVKNLGKEEWKEVESDFSISEFS